MRVKKSFLNAVSGSLILIIRAILMFAVRIVFVRTLGKMYLGVDSLFTNVLLVLSIADSGINTAINFSLYKPLADKDYKKVSSLMTFYKKVYRILGFAVLIIGLIFMPFLSFIIKESVPNIYLYYLIYLATTVVTYFISYKDSLLNADQNQYQSSLIVGSTYIIMYILRIIFLLVLPNFFVFAIIQLIMMIIQRVLVNRYITKKYDYISFKSSDKISKSEEKKIFKSIKSMFLNKIGFYLVNGTDNIIISALPKLGLGTVAVYTNYYSVVGMLENIISKAVSGVTSSFGDLAVKESKDVQQKVFDIISFLSFLIFGLFSVGFMFLLTALIKICFGASFGVSSATLLIICLNFYITGVLRPLDIIKEATGNYIQDRYANIAQAIINIILSIVLGIKFGLFGVVLATFISYILIPLWIRPFVAYKYIFDKKPYKFYFRQIIYLLSLILIYFVIVLIFKYVVINNIIISFIIKMLMIMVIYIMMISIIFGRTQEFKYIINLLKKSKR